MVKMQLKANKNKICNKDENTRHRGLLGKNYFVMGSARLEIQSVEACECSEHTRWLS